MHPPRPATAYTAKATAVSSARARGAARAFTSVALVYLAAGACLPRSAHAETALLLPPRGDDALEAEREQANRVLAEALQAQGLKVVPHAQAVAQLGPSPVADCESVDCAPALVRAASADVAAALAVWAAGDPPAPSTVFVTLVEQHGERFPGKARVVGGDLTRATKEALLDARSLELLGPGPWLRVRGKPEGAQVLLNGKLVGTVPYRAPVRSGRHTLEVRYAGLRTHAQTVDVPPNSTRQVEVEVDLAPRAGDAPALRDAESDPDREDDHVRHPMVGPIVLGSAGVALIATDIAMIASSGCDRRGALGRCESSSSINKGAAAVWGATGVAAVTGALLWYVFGTHSDASALAINAGPGGAELKLTHTF